MEYLTALHRFQLGEPGCFHALFSAKASYVYLRALEHSNSHDIARSVVADVFQALHTVLPQTHGYLLTHERFNLLLKETTDFYCTMRSNLCAAACAAERPVPPTHSFPPVLLQCLQECRPSKPMKNPSSDSSTLTVRSEYTPRPFWALRVAGEALAVVLLFLLLL